MRKIMINPRSLSMEQSRERETENRFRQIFQNSPLLVGIVNMQDRRILEVNQKGLDIIEYTYDEVAGKTPAELGLLDADTGLTEYIDSRLGRGGQIEKLEAKVHTKTGRAVFVLASVVITTINREKYLIVMAEDVTEQKRMENELARLDRLNLIGEMAASIGHEIRNPMTSVRGFLQMLGSKPEYKNDQPFFELMIEELDRANGIISEYLSMAQNKRVELKPQCLDLIIRTLYPMIESDANRREMKVSLDLNCPGEIMADEKEIRQLITNLARNGLEAMHNKGTLTIGTYQDSNQAVLFIKDQGSGISADVEAKMGVPFFTTKDSGTGLGLSVCHSIAARHGANLDLVTGPLGTTFFIRFPSIGETAPNDQA